MRSLEQAVDRAIAERNRQFLSDPEAIAEAGALGDQWRQQLVLEGQTYLAIPGDLLPDGTVKE